MIPFMPPIVASIQPIVTLSGQVIQHNSGGSNATAGVRFGTDGTVDEREGGTYTQIDTATDWVRPSSAADSTYEIRYINHVGSAFTTAAAAENAWVDLGTIREWLLEETGGGIRSCSADFQIRKDGGSPLDTGAYSFTADDT